jgi:hypothetical protein
VSEFNLSNFWCAFCCAHASTQGATNYFGTGLVCNQLEDVERYVALYHEGDSADAAVDDVNHEAGQLACDMMTLAYIRGEDIKIIHIAGGFGAIAKVAVVGVHTGTQWLSVPPQEQFMIVSVEDREA